MQITRMADYATRVLIHLAALPAGTRANRVTLAKLADVPMEFLGKVLQALTRARLIYSHRGVNGGFELARASSGISMLDIVEAIEGPIILNVCTSHPDACPRQWWCAAHDVWADAQDALKKVLAAATVDQLAQKSIAAQDRRLLVHVETGADSWN
jgi:Rrf2 family protein